MNKTINKLVLFLSFLAIIVLIIGCPDDDDIEPTKAKVNGTLILPQEANGKEYWVLIDHDLDGDNGYVTATSGTCGSGTTVNYTISNVTSGTYFIFAGVRIFSAPNSPPKEGDYVGYYGGTLMNPPGAPNAGVSSSGTVTFNITMEVMGASSAIWTTKSPMLTKRTSLGPHAAVVDGKIYVIGGFDGENTLSSGEVYNPATDTWNYIQSMPTGRSQPDLAVVNGKIYVIGGSSDFPHPTSVLLEYDPNTDNWTTKANMPTARKLLTASVVNGQIYAMGGIDISDTYLPTVELYNPSTDSWTTKKCMNSAKSRMASSVVNGKIYVLGGSEYNVPVPTIEEYDPISDTWSVVPASITPRFLLTSVVFMDKIYACGGTVPNVGVSDLVEEFDPLTNSMKIVEYIPTARVAITSAILDGKVYIIGGRKTNGDITNIVEVCTPPQ